jgi:hypothetical protein
VIDPSQLADDLLALSDHQRLLVLGFLGGYDPEQVAYGIRVVKAAENGEDLLTAIYAFPSNDRRYSGD